MEDVYVPVEKHNLLATDPRTIITSSRRGEQQTVITSTRRWSLVGKILISLAVSLGVVSFVICTVITRWELAQIKHDLDQLRTQVNGMQTMAYDEDSSDGEVDENVKYRSRRETRGSNSNPASPGDTEASGATPSPACIKCRGRKKASAIHLEAEIDRNLLARTIANGLPNTLGNFTRNGFLPFEQIYRIWKPTTNMNSRLFEYNDANGKVNVTKGGIYLIYAQVMFHGPSARKSYGVHVNDELVPFIEAISFETLRQTRPARSIADVFNPSVNSATVENEDEGDVTIDVETDNWLRRMRRSAGGQNDYATYNQCNTFAVRKLEAGDQVFLRSLERWRTIIPQKSLTFWGMVKL